MFRDFRDELFQPFIVQFKESLPAILRILTWDFTNPYGGFSECLPLVILIQYSSATSGHLFTPFISTISSLTNCLDLNFLSFNPIFLFSDNFSCSW